MQHSGLDPDEHRTLFEWACREGVSVRCTGSQQPPTGFLWSDRREDPPQYTIADLQLWWELEAVRTGARCRTPAYRLRPAQADRRPRAVTAAFQATAWTRAARPSSPGMAALRDEASRSDTSSRTAVRVRTSPGANRSAVSSVR